MFNAIRCGPIRCGPLTIAALLLWGCVGCARGDGSLWPARSQSGIRQAPAGESAACYATLAAQEMPASQVAPLPTPMPPLPEQGDRQMQPIDGPMEQAFGRLDQATRVMRAASPQPYTASSLAGSTRLPPPAAAADRLPATGSPQTAVHRPPASSPWVR